MLAIKSPTATEFGVQSSLSRWYVNTKLLALIQALYIITCRGKMSTVTISCIQHLAGPCRYIHSESMDMDLITVSCMHDTCNIHVYRSIQHVHKSKRFSELPINNSLYKWSSIKWVYRHWLYTEPVLGQHVKTKVKKNETRATGYIERVYLFFSLKG